METYPKSMAHPWASRLRVSVVVGLVLALVFGALGVTPAKADTTTGLVLHWTFEEGSGTVTQDQTLNDLDGSISAPEGSWSPDVPPGSSGHSIYLGGVSLQRLCDQRCQHVIPQRKQRAHPVRLGEICGWR